MNIGFAAVTTRGLFRPDNQDAVAAGGALLIGEVLEPVTGCCGPGRSLFAVADGVGGLKFGGRASQELVKSLISGDPPNANSAACIDAVCQAALGVHAAMLLAPETAGMATTIAGVALNNSAACWFNVGDSRVYLLRDGRLTQLSIDDTELGYSGTRPRAMLTRSIGGSRQITPFAPHTGEVDLVSGDRLLICSDGVWNCLPDEDTAAILMRVAEPGEATYALLKAVLEAGARDNVSVVLLQS